MKAKMAEGGEYFSIGSIVACKTCHGQKIEGEVMAFDPQTKMLILKTPASSAKANLNDVRIVNLSLVSQVEVKSEPTSPSPTLTALSLHKLSSRAKQNVEEKIRLVNAYSVSGVSPEGHKIFLAITKTLDEVYWSGKNIIIMNQVTISPPYGVENCKGKEDSKALIHVKKIVEKYYRDQQMPPTQPATSQNTQQQA